MKQLAAQKWNECLALIKSALANDTAFAMWFEPTEAVSLQDNVLKLKLQGEFVKDLYEGKYLSVLKAALYKVIGPDFSVRFIVPKSKPPVSTDAGKPNLGEMPKEPLPSRKTATQKKARKDGENTSERLMPQLNESLSFENFCVSPCNKLPWTIAESIARQPVNSAFNPFFLYGDVGVGKTHLMQAIGLHVKKAFPDKKVVFLPMKEFQRLYQNAYLQREIPAFLQWFMKCDVLLFDDLQEIAGSEGTLNNALFPIFSHLQMHGRQLVFTCDRAPQDLKELEDRLIDRFKWGIVEKLERPDADLRKKILSFKARNNNLELSEEVIDFIAAAPLSSVREIEGIVLNMYTRAINLGLEIDLDLARQVVANVVRSSRKKAVNFDMIVEVVAEDFHLNPDVIFSKSRIKDVADSRMVIMYLAQRLLGLSTGAIGRRLGRKHSTVIHGIKTIGARMAADPGFASKVSDLEKSL